VPDDVPLCPRCGSDETQILTRMILRIFHVCHTCGKTFEILESQRRSARGNAARLTDEYACPCESHRSNEVPAAHVAFLARPDRQATSGRAAWQGRQDRPVRRAIRARPVPQGQPAPAERGPLTVRGRNDVLATLHDQIEHIYHELDIQMKRMAQIQAELDNVRATVRRLVPDDTSK
jgi:hypothetical protein